MAEQNDPMLEEMMAFVENEPINAPYIAPTVNIPALREELAVLVSTADAKKRSARACRKNRLRG